MRPDGAGDEGSNAERAGTGIPTVRRAVSWRQGLRLLVGGLGNCSSSAETPITVRHQHQHRQQDPWHLLTVVSKDHAILFHGCADDAGSVCRHFCVAVEGGLQPRPGTHPWVILNVVCGLVMPCLKQQQ